eukprot:659862-Pyramimonas_sp.AAC.1
MALPCGSDWIYYGKHDRPGISNKSSSESPISIKSPREFQTNRGTVKTFWRIPKEPRAFRSSNESPNNLGA